MSSKISVTFERLYNQSVGWDVEDNVSPYISMADPEDDITHQRRPNEIVIPYEKIRIKFSYPLSKPAIFEYTAPTKIGFTRAEVARKVSEGYKRIYREEDEAVGPTGMSAPDSLNRAKSKGPHGIWGHHIGDLLLIDVEQSSGNLFTISVDS